MLLSPACSRFSHTWALLFSRALELQFGVTKCRIVMSSPPWKFWIWEKFCTPPACRAMPCQAISWWCFSQICKFQSRFDHELRSWKWMIFLLIRIKSCPSSESDTVLLMNFLDLLMPHRQWYIIEYYTHWVKIQIFAQKLTFDNFNVICEFLRQNSWYFLKCMKKLIFKF